MKKFFFLAGLSLMLALFPLRAEEPARPAKPGQSFQVPFRLTNSLHTLVRAKINGQGPFHFIIDTGAPILFVSTPVGKKLGLISDAKGLATLDRFELEGGVVINQVKCRVETPFQLEGMNGLGLAGLELHGIIGFSVLASFRMELDFTRDAMKWTRLDFSPPYPLGIRVKGGGDGGLEVIGSLLKFLGFLAGKKADVETAPRGFLGLELDQGEESVQVRAVLAGGPAAKAGLQAGDRLHRVQGHKAVTLADVHRALAGILSGQEVRLTVNRNGQTLELSLTAGEGL